ncbi:MAG: threonine ammonia-lyase [Sulfobacillus benefaciens]|uniref:threonine ammonia-lyase n=1 Tax=Sulfobacillus benefaciens TaxID=453960 RepID=A0A2T2XLM1_9FIRM|nr:MAG: threonine ammonia-lyase [Sulfobacillus benefaciens]
MIDTPSLSTICEAKYRLLGVIHRTPLVTSHSFPLGSHGELRFKAENLQVTGAFKIRGAFNKVAQLAAQANSGVVTASSGNHGQAVAWAARYHHMSAHVVVPLTAPKSKVAAAKAYGATVEYCGTTSQERLDRAQEFAQDRGYQFVPPYDDVSVMSGQGTIGLEIIEDWPEVDMVLVPIGGGGLISGIATAIKSIRPDIAVVGIEAMGAAKAWQSRQQGFRVVLDHTDTIADGIKTLGLGLMTYPIVEKNVDRLLTVSEESIAEAVRWLLTRPKLVVEPSGATTMAAILSYPEMFQDKNVVAVLSGGNLDPEVLSAILSES